MFLAQINELLLVGVPEIILENYLRGSSKDSEMVNHYLHENPPAQQENAEPGTPRPHFPLKRKGGFL